MKSSLTEVKFLFLIMAAIFLLMAVHFFQPQLSNLYHTNDYVGIHTFLEFISISLAAAIFIFGLKSFETTRSSRLLLLAFTFFAVAGMDLLHTLSFKGMPAFIMNSSAVNAAWFWVLARGMESIFMLLLILLPNRKVKREYRGFVILAGLLLTVFSAIFVMQIKNSQPMMEGSSAVFIENIIQYGSCILKFLSILILFYQYFLEKSSATLSITLALVFLLLSEFILTVYQNVENLDNLTGHLFKIIGYYYILKGFYFTETASEFEKLYMLISEQPGFIFQLNVRKKECRCTFCEGSLLAEIGLFPKEMYTKTSLAIFKILGHTVEEYCLSPENTREQQSFKTNYLDKTLLISLQRLPVSEGTWLIIGSVLEIRRD